MYRVTQECLLINPVNLTLWEHNTLKDFLLSLYRVTQERLSMEVEQDGLAQ